MLWPAELTALNLSPQAIALSQLRHGPLAALGVNPSPSSRGEPFCRLKKAGLKPACQKEAKEAAFNRHWDRSKSVAAGFSLLILATLARHHTEF